MLHIEEKLIWLLGVVGASALAIAYRYGGLIHTEEMGICRFECLLLAAKLAERIRVFFCCFCGEASIHVYDVSSPAVRQNRPHGRALPRRVLSCQARLVSSFGSNPATATTLGRLGWAREKRESRPAPGAPTRNAGALCVWLGASQTRLWQASRVVRDNAHPDRPAALRHTESPNHRQPLSQPVPLP